MMNQVEFRRKRRTFFPEIARFLVSTLSKCTSTWTYANALSIRLSSKKTETKKEMKDRNFLCSRVDRMADLWCHRRWTLVEMVTVQNGVFAKRRPNFHVGLRMTSPGTRMPPNPIGHPGPGGPPPPPNAYRPPGMPPAMSPSMNQTGPRMYMTNSPGVRHLTSILFFSTLYLSGWRLFFLISCTLWRMYFIVSVQIPHRIFTFRLHVQLVTHLLHLWCQALKIPMETKCHLMVWEICLVVCHPDLIQW